MVKIDQQEPKTVALNFSTAMKRMTLKFVKIEKEIYLWQEMKWLYENKIKSVLVEGGAFTLQ